MPEELVSEVWDSQQGGINIQYQVKMDKRTFLG